MATWLSALWLSYANKICHHLSICQCVLPAAPNSVFFLTSHQNFTRGEKSNPICQKITHQKYMLFSPTKSFYQIYPCITQCTDNKIKWFCKFNIFLNLISIFKTLHSSQNEWVQCLISWWWAFFYIVCLLWPTYYIPSVSCSQHIREPIIWVWYT